MNKLASIYNVWDGCELLKHSIDSIKEGIDLFIIVYQTESNWGEKYDPLPEILEATKHVKTIISLYTPTEKSGFNNEKAKRNLGIELAKSFNCTHFLNIDTDECYQNFTEAKDLYFKSGKKGSACRIYTYFKLPTLRFETEDGYFVPFIHELLPNTESGVNPYPYYVDPTRRINCSDVILLDIHMHHYSYIRKDIMRKVNNSSARNNIANGTVVEDYNNPNVAPGFYVRDFAKKLIEVPNYFCISI